MSRSLKKFIYIPEKILFKTFLDNESKLSMVMMTRDRSSVILPEFENKKLRIYTGKEYKEVTVKEDTTLIKNIKFGEIAFTKMICKYRRKKKGKKKNFKK